MSSKVTMFSCLILRKSKGNGERYMVQVVQTKNADLAQLNFYFFQRLLLTMFRKIGSL